MMETGTWYYYNHAMLPKKAPHEEADLSPLKDGSLWHNPNKPLLARWTSDFDCGHETKWWYCIKDDDFSLETMKSKQRKKILASLENTDVRMIDMDDYADALYGVYTQAFSKYDFSSALSRDSYLAKTKKDKNDGIACWGAFLKGTDTLVAYRKCILFPDCVDFSESKYDPAYLNLRISEALTYVMLDYYLNTCQLKYVFSGERTINHATNMQSFYEEHFGFRRAFCKLHIAYRPGLLPLIKLLACFRAPISALGKHSSLLHQVDAILKMEKIAAVQRKNTKGCHE